ncbi:O-succinylbenzoate synthase [Cryobacterium sp. TMT1-21]|uniref:o-succinylbenzoate synthase n=1 Tax=Cryobacterium shii TaxID=1259235 RepID=A0AAQ2HFB9_9MICO|nr:MULTISPECIES: o-succinylbenzoate synthase [Cryobacterium]TFC45609.1 O-succinylbenzoate synthase [Cryobacterium shii]TFC85783.1 O-succinylbenzoate synthase [Cryobacterium sp. TmT2-59]TFD16476.1 O-succinylbenzoate synthase [Cryobacterium sp. TMT1-21]TFD16924.1 O-succinylbenzoate synthase [Cryobacterium sp. TMT4-10]TFD23600.1 O-succinylbenzoate synthase [Cryobacterium sp. TMT2-23]
MLPTLAELLGSARVVALPLVTRFRGIDTREALLLEGPQGWAEFSPFADYDDAEAAAWLRAAIDFGWLAAPALLRDSIPVNATVPAVSAEDVAGVLARFPGCRTAKVKVADPGQTLADDVARVRAVRKILGPEGRIRVDANGLWNVDEAEHAIHALNEFDLEYVEQPCATIEELAEIRRRTAYLDVGVAADESVRRAEDPLLVARTGSADILVIKAAPLGGIHAALALVEQAGLPAVVSSALDTSVGISMGAHLAGAIPNLEFDCGLGTASLLAADVTTDPLLPVDGRIPVRRVTPDPALLEQYAAADDRRDWWLARLTRCHALLAD